ncbi:MAG: RNA polymerase sigma factor SigZ [Planctomycetota bacterium]
MAEGIDTYAIWNGMHDRLLNYIRGHVPTVEDAEDVLQDVFVRIHAKLGQLADADNLSGWIYGITRNAVADFHRRKNRGAGVLETLAEDADGAASADAGDSATAPGPDPARLMAGCMQPLVAQLPEKYRRAVELTELEGATQAEAAGKLGISVSGAKSRVQRGRAMLKDMLSDCCAVELDGRGGVIGFERCGPDCGDCDCSEAAGEEEGCQ